MVIFRLILVENNCLNFSYLLGPTAVKELVMVNQPLLKRPRPTYCLSMKGLAICLAGFTDKEDAVTSIILQCDSFNS